MAEEIKKKGLVQEGDDYARCPVPEDKRKSWISTCAVYIGSCICLSAFTLGGVLSAGLTLTNSIIATAVGTLFLTVMTCVCGEVTLHNHLSTSMIGRFAFGMENLKEVLEAAGSDFDHVLKVNIYLSDVKDFPVVNEIYKEYITGENPARTCLQIARIPLDALLEIEAIAIEK